MEPSAGRTGGKSSNCKPGCDERDGWPVRHRILDMHRTGMTGWPEIQVEINPLKDPYVTEMGKL